MKKSLIKSTALLLSLMMNWVGLLAVGETVASYNDTESSRENSFNAGEINLTASPEFFELGLDAGETSFSDILLSSSTLSFPFAHTGSFLASSTNPFCSGVTLIASASTTEGMALAYSGPLANFVSPATSTLGIWNFEFTAGAIIESDYDDTCDFEFIFNASTTPPGFSDNERVRGIITARKQIVLNEFLPNPTGDDSTGEWVEIYNRGNMPRDIANWSLRNSTSTTVFITVLNTNLATTTIAPEGFLVVYIDGAFLNNGSFETLSLFNASDVLADSFDYCGETAGSTFATCDPKATNMSWARIPDGEGTWIDPIPTPGMPNIISDIEPPTDPSSILPLAGEEDTKASPPAKGEVGEARRGSGISTTTEENTTRTGMILPAGLEEVQLEENNATTSENILSQALDTVSEVLESAPEDYVASDATTIGTSTDSQDQDTQDAPQDTPVAEQMQSPSSRSEGEEVTEVVPAEGSGE